MVKKFALAFCALFLVAATPALADDHRYGRARGWHGDHDRDHGKWRGKHHKRDYGEWRGKHHKKHFKHHRARGRHWVPPGHRKVVVHKHYGHGHKHHRDYRRDNDWAIFAILGLQIVDVLNESQRNNYAWAQQQAYSAPVGQTIQWHDGGAYGSVIPVREGSDTAGRYCREFQQEVIVGNRRESGYGIACRQPDGAWQMVSN